MTLSIDFETASECDLISLGVYHYAQHMTTRVLMMGWAFDDEPVQVWLPTEPFPQRVIDHVKAGGLIYAWNAQFERLIWWYVLGPDLGLPEPKLEQFRCAAARARAHGLPGALKDAARLLNRPLQKQASGQRLIKLYCVPKHNPVIPPEDLALFIEYCRRDVDVERNITSVLRDLDPSEWEDYYVNERINDRGVPVDVKVAEAIQQYGDIVREDANIAIRVLTNGAVQNARARSTRNAWLLERLTPEQIDIISDDGVLKFGQYQRDRLLEAFNLAPEVRELTEHVNEAGGATLIKYKAFCNRQIDGRLHGAFMFSGGGQTGRYSSTGIQLHNLRRDVFENPQEVIDKILKGEPIPTPAKAISRLIRSIISKPDGLAWVDYSNIEGRIAPWLEGTGLGEAKLDLFRHGIDPYVFNASATFHVPMPEVTKAQRQAGKIQELALQFGGGIGALQHMGSGYGLVIDDQYGRSLRDAWRKANPWMMSFSRALTKAVMDAIRTPKDLFTAGRVSYEYDGSSWLWCNLPSGRRLAYLNPEIIEVDTPYGQELAVSVIWGGAKPKVDEVWPRRTLHGGLLIENCTQAAAACLLRDAINRCDKAGIDLVAHVHDELVAENVDKETLRDTLLMAPTWAGGLPITASAESGIRYGK